MNEEMKKQIMFKESKNSMRGSKQVYFNKQFGGLFTIKAINKNQLIIGDYCQFYEDAKIYRTKQEIFLAELNEAIPLVKENINKYLTIDRRINALRLKSKYY